MSYRDSGIWNWRATVQQTDKVRAAMTIIMMHEIAQTEGSICLVSADSQ